MNEYDDNEPFSDMPEGAQTGADGQPAASSGYIPPVKSAPRPQVTRPPEPIVEEEYEEVEEVEELENEEDFDDVLSDAQLRLEQGSLYRLIIGHNLFEGSDADPKAIQNVQKEIRQFAKERMEVMLGMRKETASVERLEIDFPFNEAEVIVLRTIAKTFSKGATEDSDNYVPEVRRVTEEVPTVGKRPTLNPIGSGPKKQVKKQLQNKPRQPVQRARVNSKLDETIERIAREEGIPRELLEEDAGLSTKPVHEMTASELEQRNRTIAKRRGVQAKSSAALPMPSYEQQEMMAIAHAAKASGSPLMTKIIEQVKKMPTGPQ